MNTASGQAVPCLVEAGIDSRLRFLTRVHVYRRLTKRYEQPEISFNSCMICSSNFWCERHQYSIAAKTIPGVLAENARNSADPIRIEDRPERIRLDKEIFFI